MASAAALSPGRGRIAQSAGIVSAYAFPGLLVWGVLGALLGNLGRFSVVEAMAVAYAGLWGSIQALMLPIKLPNSGWQVPARWIATAGPTRQTLIWGSLLGPGLLTSNSFASMWLLPIVLSMAGSMTLGAEIGLVSGCAHGFSRACGILRSLRSPCSSSSIQMPMLKVRWRVIDGLGLVFCAGFMASGLIFTR